MNNIKAKFKINKANFNLDVNFSLPLSGITALYGESGSGKTTLLRAIAGLDKYDDSYLKIADDIWQDENKFIAPHNRDLAYVFQESSIFEHLDVEQNLQYGYKRIALNKRKISLEKAINFLDIKPLLKRKSFELSLGEKQRVAIARALVLSPKLLLMDEPLAALDFARKKKIMPYIASLNKELNIPIIYVSHSNDEVAYLADYLMLISNGKIKESGDISNMLTRFDLPLALDYDAESIIDAEVKNHDKDNFITTLLSKAGEFSVLYNKIEIGSKVRIRILAKDVSITLKRQENTSILNIFPAIIDDLSYKNKAQISLRLLIGDNIPILAKVTYKSYKNLKLKKSKKVYIQVKSVALIA